jgi:peptide/nickel transport system substrate-binding protein
MLSGGGAQLPSTLGTVAGAIISPKALANPSLDLSQGPGDAGSGPYKVVEFKPSDRTVYEQAQAPGEYWDPSAGLLKRFTWLYVANGAQRINGVRAEDLDLAQITTTDVPAAADVAKQAGFGGRRATLALTQHQFFMRATNAPLDNLKLRQAISYAFDKSSIGDGLYGGSCTPATQFYPESHWAHDPRIDSLYSYDVAKAKDLIKQSGVTDLTFGQAFSPLYETPAPAAQAMLKAVGITTELQPLPYADLVTQWFAGSVDSMYGGVVGSVDPAQYLFDIYLSGQKLIPEGERAEFAALADKANDPTLSQDERGAIYKDIFYKIAQNAYTVPVCNSQQFWLEHGQVGGLDRLMFTFIGLVDPRYLYAVKS